MLTTSQNSLLPKPLPLLSVSESFSLLNVRLGACKFELQEPTCKYAALQKGTRHYHQSQLHQQDRCNPATRTVLQLLLALLCKASRTFVIAPGTLRTYHLSEYRKFRPVFDAPLQASVQTRVKLWEENPFGVSYVLGVSHVLGVHRCWGFIGVGVS